jgi:hypothetical protein
VYGGETQAYEKQILLSLVNSTVQDTSIKEDIGYEAIMGIIDRYIERDINWEDVTRLDVIGLDEISLKKGHRDWLFRPLSSAFIHAAFSPTPCESAFNSRASQSTKRQ